MARPGWNAVMASPEFGPAIRLSSCCCGSALRLEHGLDLEVNRDLVSDDGATSLERGVEVDTEVATVDVCGCGEAGARAAVSVRAEAVQLKAQRDVPGHALERELPIEDQIVAVLADAGGAVGHRGVGLDLEEVGAADVVVALGVAGVDRVELDRRGYRRVRGVLASHNLAFELREAATDLRHDHVPDNEADIGVDRVDGPGAGQVARNSFDRGACSHRR